MALISGLDLGFVKDEGFRKFTVVVILMAGLILFAAKGLMPTGECVNYLFEIVLVYAGYNVGTKWLSQIKKNGQEKPVEEVKP